MTILTEEADSWGERVPNTSQTERKAAGNHPSIHPFILLSLNQCLMKVPGGWGWWVRTASAFRKMTFWRGAQMQLEVVFHRAHAMKEKARNPVQPLPSRDELSTWRRLGHYIMSHLCPLILLRKKKSDWIIHNRFLMHPIPCAFQFLTLAFILSSGSTSQGGHPPSRPPYTSHA